MEPTLSSVTMHLTTGDDGLDGDSHFTVRLYSAAVDNIADGGISSTIIRKGDKKDLPLDMHDNTVKKSEMNATTFYLEIQAVGRDIFNGDITLDFNFSDGERKSFHYGAFEIGTFHMSNSTRKAVQI